MDLSWNKGPTTATKIDLKKSTSLTKKLLIFTENSFWSRTRFESYVCICLVYSNFRSLSLV